MSTKNKKNSAGAASVRTSMRTAPVCLVLGVVCLVLGAMFLLSQVWHGGSTALEELSYSLQGLSGQLCLLLPLLLLLIGVKLLVSLGHQVAVKDVLILCALYFLVLAFQTLITMITGRGSLMAYIGQINEQRVVAHPASYGAYLRRAYALGAQCGGGLFGMLLAYPLWKVLGQVGGAVLLGCAMAVLFLLLVRVNPAEMINQTSDRMEERKAQRAARKREMQQQQEPVREKVQHLPMEEMHPGQQVNHVQAPAYTAPGGRYAPAEEYAFPVSNEQYGYVRQDEHVPQENVSGYGSQVFYPVSNEQIYDEPFRQEQEAVPAEMAWQPVPPPQEGPQEELPWYDEVVPLEDMVNEPVLQDMMEAPQIEESIAEKPAPRETAARTAAEPAVKKKEAQPAPREDKLASSASSWMDQLNERRRQAEMAPADGQLTEQVTSGHAKPVFTEDAVKLTGERIPIRGSARRDFAEDEKPQKDLRLDGTARDPKERIIGAPVLIDYQAPPIRFLKEGTVTRQDHSAEDHDRAEKIETTLKSFNIPAEVKQIMHGPAITRFAIQIAPGIRVGRVTSMADNLALNLANKHVRMEAPIQGTNYIGIEVPNANVTPVMIREILESEAMRNHPSPLAVALGKDIAGAPVVCDLSTMPHLLIAGSTGSGKSVCIQSIVCSILFRASPAQVRLIMVDPKQVELNMYNGIPHLLIPVVTDMRKAAGALSWAVQEMQDRYSKIGAIGEHDLKGYNARQTREEDKLPSIVIIIDEMADLMDTCRKDVEESIRRLAALARAAGIYMVLATQRPSVDVITGVIKNNIPSRIAFAVTSGTDSRTILDMYGAEKLVGKGDMLYKPSGVAPVRVQGSFVSAAESNSIAEYIRKHYQADYDPNIMEQLDKTQQDAKEAPENDDLPGDDGEGRLDDLLHEAIQMAIEDGQTSTSMLQRRLRIGYARAGRLVDEMEKRGIVSAQDGSKPRKTIITREQYYDMFADDEV